MRYLLVWSRKHMLIVTGWDEVEKLMREHGRPPFIFRESDALTQAQFLGERSAFDTANPGWRT